MKVREFLIERAKERHQRIKNKLLVEKDRLKLRIELLKNERNTSAEDNC